MECSLSFSLTVNNITFIFQNIVFVCIWEGLWQAELNYSTSPNYSNSKSGMSAKAKALGVKMPGKKCAELPLLSLCPHLLLFITEIILIIVICWSVVSG